AKVAAGWAVPAFAAATSPTVGAALAGLVAGGARRVALASWFLAPGLLPERVHAAALAAYPDVRLAEPLGADPAVADVVLDRYDAAATPLPEHHSA
ncbi:MAG: sirohydrochlorin chelatase, partial [Actinomycetota bacterium]|nr:sirohydrochlorin chelatase [Actinomycetota bacterium]